MVVVNITSAEKTLQEAFYEAAVNRKDLAMLELVGQAIDLALWPWKPGKVDAYLVDPNWNMGGGPSLVFETELLPRLPCAIDVDRAEMAAHCRDHIVYNIADQAFHWFRYRPCYPVDDHIILGED